MKYRPEVDGLRTLAVVPVLLFHVGFEQFSGGFVGMDIFFVISGYLITSIIYREVENNEFSIVRFYERRIRRIFPALFAVFFATLAVGWFVLLPGPFEALGISTFWATLFVSNILFWSKSGYFDSDAESKPLLHTWSLSVEEQFYVLFPPAVMLLYRMAGRKGVVTLVTASICLSFVWAVWSVADSPNAAFFLAPARVWELGIGALLAIGAVPAIRNRSVAELAALVGIVCIGFSVFAYDSATPFPGVAALAPCIGVALVIHATSHCGTVTARVLAARPMVFVGLISYSLYLWHWPIIVFYRSYYQVAPGTAEKLLLIGGAFVLAIVSWKFIEGPFRGRTAVFGRKGLFVSAATAMSLFVGAGFAVGVTDGIPHRMPPAVLALANGSAEGTQRRECYGRSPEKVARGEVCRTGDPERAPSFLVWGDSHAYALMPGFEIFGREHGLTALYVPKGSCVPVLGVERLDRRAATGRGCAAFADAVMELVEARPELETVVLVGRWAENFEVDRFSHGPPLLLADAVAPEPGDTNSQVLQRALTRTIARLAAMNKRVVLLSQVPDVPYDVPAYLAQQQIRGDVLTEKVSRELYDNRQAGVMRMIGTLEQGSDLRVLPSSSSLCDEDSCAISRDGRLLYIDGTHVSRFGAEVVLNGVSEALVTELKANGGDAK